MCPRTSTTSVSTTPESGAFLPERLSCAGEVRGLFLQCVLGVHNAQSLFFVRR